MPFINLCVSKDVSNDEEISLKEEFGKAIKIIPGKSEDWLMINITSNAHMYFKGNNDKPLSFLELKVYGNVDSNDFNNFTKEATNIINKVLKINPDCMYFKYEEVLNWGWNGENF